MSETLCFRIAAPACERDPILAALDSLSCLGVHEQGEVLAAYFPGGAEPGPILALADEERGIRVEGPERVADQDWESRWREGLEPRRLGPLRVRPSWFEPGPGPELIIDPEQAFGSGEHASTRLALALVLEALEPGDSLLDLGTGSGILALGALRLGASRALGVDVDPVACRNAAGNRARNALPLSLLCGSLDAIAPAARFELVVANLLASRLAPWRERLAAHCARSLVLSGYLERESSSLLEPFLEAGWRLLEERAEEQSGDLWCASRLVHTRARHSSSSSPRVVSSS